MTVVPSRCAQVALWLDRTLDSVKVPRAKLGIPKHNPKYRMWIAEEERLPGTMADEEVAAQIWSDSGCGVPPVT